MVHRQELERIKSILIQDKADFESELKHLPEGNLYCGKRRGKWLYYQLLPVKGNRKKEKRIGISQDPDMIFGLVRKNYIMKALGRIENFLKRIKK